VGPVGLGDASSRAGVRRSARACAVWDTPPAVWAAVSADGDVLLMASVRSGPRCWPLSTGGSRRRPARGGAAGAVGRPGAYGDGVYGDGVYGDGAYGDGVYGDGVYGDGVYGDGVYGDGVYGDGVYGDGVYGDGVYGAARGSSRRDASRREWDGVRRLLAWQMHVSAGRGVFGIGDGRERAGDKSARDAGPAQAVLATQTRWLQKAME
jgi:hypothetical protein